MLRARRKTSSKQELDANAEVPALNGAFQALEPSIRQALHDAGYHTPTPIQEQALPYLMEKNDLIGCAQTGTGKTAAFTLPILQYLSNDRKKTVPHQPRVLILAPTRELAAQIGESIETYTKFLPFSHTVIFGGVGHQQQIRAMKSGKDIVVATPGRLIDLINQRMLSLDAIEVFVLDEADRMLDMGFLPDIRRIIDLLPAKRQSLFFSATMEPKVEQLAHTLVKNPKQITIAPETPTVDRIDQSVYFVDSGRKNELLKQVMQREGMTRVILFVRMKFGADRLVQTLNKFGISAGAIHGNKSQNARIRALDEFKEGKLSALVATDIAARGIDVDSVTHVINYELPEEPETYVHRIGRTARAGREGQAISFCAAQERAYLSNIERLIKKEVTVVTDHPFHSDEAQNATGADARPAKRGGRGGGRGNSRGQGGGRGRSSSRRDGEGRSQGGGSSDRRRSGGRKGPNGNRSGRRSESNAAQGGSENNNKPRRAPRKSAKKFAKNKPAVAANSSNSSNANSGKKSGGWFGKLRSKLRS